MTNFWYSLPLGDRMMADMPSDEIRQKFLQIFATAQAPADAAVFTRNNSEGRLHCEVTAYFSPATMEIAKWFKASPCEKPTRDHLDLLAGDEHCWEILFP